MNACRQHEITTCSDTFQRQFGRFLAMCSNVVYPIMCTMLTFLLAHFVASCDKRYTKALLYEHRCVSGSEVIVSPVDRPQCQWQCLKHKCNYINYNPNSHQCEIGLGQCESLVSASGVMVNVYWQQRDVCLHWGSYQEPGRVAVGQADLNPPRYAGRTKIGEAMVLGSFWENPNIHIWVNNQGAMTHVDHTQGNVIEVLTTIAGCPLFWVPYTGGDPLPNGAVVGGYLSDGAATYIARKHYSTDIACGYYNTEMEKIYFASGAARTSSTMELLVLIWWKIVLL